MNLFDKEDEEEMDVSINKLKTLSYNVGKLNVKKNIGEVTEDFAAQLKSTKEMLANHQSKFKLIAFSSDTSAYAYDDEQDEEVA